MFKTLRTLIVYSTLLLTFQFGFSQVCYDELTQDLDPNTLTERATGHDVALIMKRALEIIEPAMPPFQAGIDDNQALSAIPLDHQDYELYEYVSQRFLLPNTWNPDEIVRDPVHRMFKRMHGWYKLPEPREPSKWYSKEEIIADLMTTFELMRTAGKNEGVAVVAAKDRSANELSFLALVRLAGPYPRMLVYNPPVDEIIDINSSLTNVFPYLENCLYELDDYIYANASTAQRLFISNNESKMYILNTEPKVLDGYYLVPQGEEINYFEYTADVLQGSERYVALFDGPTPNPFTIARLMSSVRTNMTPNEAINFFLGR